LFFSESPIIGQFGTIFVGFFNDDEGTGIEYDVLFVMGLGTVTMPPANAEVRSKSELCRSADAED
jgi:hypothetical protein